jgi:hypothetical protein
MLVLLNLKRLQTLHSKLIPVSTSGGVSNTTPRSVVHPRAERASEEGCSRIPRHHECERKGRRAVAHTRSLESRSGRRYLLHCACAPPWRILFDGFQSKQQRRHQTDVMSISPFVCCCCVLFGHSQGGGLASVSRGAALKLGDEARLNDLFNKYAGTARDARASVLFPRIRIVLTDPS